MANLEFTASAGQLIRELGKAESQIRDVAKSFNNVIDEVKEFNKAGEITRRTIKAADETGKELTVTWKRLRDGTINTTAAVKENALATERAAKAQQKLADAEKRAAKARRARGQRSQVRGRIIGRLDEGGLDQQKLIQLRRAQADIVLEFAKGNAELFEFDALLEKLDAGKVPLITGALTPLQRKLENLILLEQKFSAQLAARPPVIPTQLPSQVLAQAAESEARRASLVQQLTQEPFAGVGAAVKRNAASQEAFNRVLERGRELGALLEKEVEGVADAVLRATKQAEREAKILKEQVRLERLRKEAREELVQGPATGRVPAAAQPALTGRIDPERAAQFIPGEQARDFQQGRLAVLREVAASTRGQVILESQVSNQLTNQQRLRQSILKLENDETRLGKQALQLLREQLSSEEQLARDLQNQQNFLERGLRFEDLAANAARVRAANESRVSRELLEQLEILKKIKDLRSPDPTSPAPPRRPTTRQPGVDIPDVERAQSIQLLEAQSVRSAANRLTVLRAINSTAREALATDQVRLVNEERRRQGQFTLSAAAERELRIRTAINNVLVGARRRLTELGGLQGIVRKRAQETLASVQRLGKSLSDLARIGGISLFIGQLFELQTAISEAATTAATLSIRIAEIETIANDAGLSTEQWAEGLRQLAGEFGIDILSQAESAYQTLSNQIRNANNEALNGAETLEFLREANRLAVVGVTDTASATDLLTGALNAFQLPAERAGEVSAQLFKAVELGRIRVDDLAQSFGRVGVPANQLGVSIEELLGTIATITVQGVKSNEAFTFLRGIFQKLLRPTDALKRVFNELGVASGEALIAQRGLVGALNAIQEVGGSSSTELAELFNRVRALTGALALSGENAERAAESIEQIRNAAGAAFDEDVNRVLNSTGQRLKRASEEAQAFFERGISPILTGAANLIDRLGGMEEILNDIKDGFIAFTTVLVPAALALKGFFAVLAAGTILAAPAAAGLALVGAALAGMGLAAAAGTQETERQFRAINKETAEFNRQRLDQIKEISQAQQKARQLSSEDLRSLQRDALTVTAANLRNANSRRAALEKVAAESKRVFEASIKGVKDVTNAQIREANKAITAFENNAKQAAKLIDEILARRGQAGLQLSLDIGGPGQDVNQLRAEVANIFGEVQQNAQEGNLELFKENLKQLEDLSKRRIAAEVEFEKQSSVLRKQRLSAEVAVLRARSSAERRIARERVNDLQRQQQLLEQGSQRQLENEQKLAEAVNRARTAQTADQFNKATEEIRELQEEQDRLNRLAEREKEIREEGLQLQKRLAEEALKIQRINTQRAEAERKRVAEAKALQIAFDLQSKQISDFNSKQLDTAKTAEDVVKIARQQLQAFEQLRQLSSRIGGGAEADRVIQQRAANFREQVEQRITQLSLKRQQDEIAAIKRQADAVEKADDEAATRARQRRDQIIGFVQRLRQGFDETRETLGPGRSFGRGEQRAAALLGRPLPVTEALSGQRQQEIRTLLAATELAVKNIEKEVPKAIKSGSVEGLRGSIGALTVTLRQLVGPTAIEETNLQDVTFAERQFAASAQTVLNSINQLPKIIERQAEADAANQDKLAQRTENNIQNIVKGFDTSREKAITSLRQPFDIEQPTTQGLTRAAENAKPAFVQTGEAAGDALGRKAAEVFVQETRRRQTEQAQARRPEFRPKPIDTTIRLGQGAPSVIAQQARIQQALQAQAEQRRKVERKQREDEETERLKQIAKARAEGRLITNERGTFIRGAPTGLTAQFKDQVAATDKTTQAVRESADKVVAAVKESSGIGRNVTTRAKTLSALFEAPGQDQAQKDLLRETGRTGRSIRLVTPGTRDTLPGLTGTFDPGLSGLPANFIGDPTFTPTVEPFTTQGRQLRDLTQPETLNIDLGGVSIEVNGVNDPKAIAGAIIPELERAYRAGQTRIQTNRRR